MLKRFSFTLFTLGLLILGAVITDTYRGELSPVWLDRVGFAPTDLTVLNLVRLFTSAVVTNGGAVFWQALGMTAFAVGLAEWRTSSWRAALTFWGVHLLTLLLMSLVIALPLHWSGVSIGSLVALSRDVGPSAGYFGALGLVSATLRKPWRWVAGGAVVIGLFISLLTISGQDVGMELSADLAHLLAFPLGWFSWRVLHLRSP